jgi:hypothetical protein
MENVPGVTPAAQPNEAAPVEDAAKIKGDLANMTISNMGDLRKKAPKEMFKWITSMASDMIRQNNRIQERLREIRKQSYPDG